MEILETQMAKETARKNQKYSLVKSLIAFENMSVERNYVTE